MITIIIPTMNRVDFVLRQLNYYKILNFKGIVLIGDSSGEINKKILINSVKNLNMKNFKVIDCPNLNTCEVPSFLLHKHVKTKYVTMIGDDDFFIPNGVDKSIEFLENNNDYVACHGKSFMINTFNDKPYGKINGLYPYRQPSLEIDDMKERLLEFSKNYSTSLFVVHRTEAFKKMYQNCSIKDKRFSEELLPAFAGPAIGKYKELDVLFMVRQAHQSRYLLPGIQKWVTDEKWLHNYSQFKSIFVSVLCEFDENINLNEAEISTDDVMGLYINNAYSRHKEGWNFKKTLKNILFKYSLVKQIYQKYLNLSDKNIDKKLYNTLTTNENYKEDFLYFKNFVEELNHI